MSDKLSRYRGAVLGMAVGDAMGHTIEGKTWDQIREDYGPNGLMGYDLVNGQAEVTSYTQIAAYIANAALLAVTRGKPELTPRYAAMALREWYKRQYFPRDPEPTPFWVARLPQLRRRFCMDSWMQDAIRQELYGTPEAPKNRFSYPGALPASAMIGLSFDPKRTELRQAGQIAEQVMALTHGDRETMLCAVVLTYAMIQLVTDPEMSLREDLIHAVDRMHENYGFKYPQAETLTEKLHAAIDWAQTPSDPQKIMEGLTCSTGAQCLGAAMFACLVHPEDFDSAMILAVNHSGRSAAVGALTGAMLGARLGAEALPEFYLESLEPRQDLWELAKDLSVGSPTAGLFDDDWDHKYSC